MRRYLVAAAALKLASTNGLTRQAYRAFGNRKRSQRSHDAVDLHDDYIRDGNRFAQLFKTYDVVHPHDKLLELGTGWSHAHALFVRLNFDVEISMFDIADIRNFDGCLAHLTALSKGLDPEQITGVDSATLTRALNSRSFGELYQILSLKYIIQSEGSLADIPDNTFQCVFSGDVFEHIPAENAQRTADEIYRILKPGGYSIHIIGLDDHLAHYDSKASPKNYYRYSDTVWKWFFQNKLQYFNRIQASEWLRYFDNSGFSCLETDTTWSRDLGSLPVNAKYRSYSADDLSCCRLQMVHRKPLA